MSVTLVWRTDVHLSDHTPISRTDNWTDTILGKIRFVGEYAERIGANAVIDGGDFFDIKSPSRNSHELVRRAIEVHRKHYKCPVYANVGNHDCVYGDYGFLHQQPLGVLYESAVFQRLYDAHEATFVGADGFKVRIVGIPYHGVKYDLTRFSRIQRGDEDLLIAVAHVLASPTETQMFEGEDVIRYDWLDAYAPQVVIFGHWHKDQGIQTTPNGKTVINVGSLSRGSLSEDSMERIPRIVVIRASREGVSFEPVNLPVAPASDVFTIEARDKKTLADEVIVQFVDKVAKILLPTTRIPLRDVVASLTDVPDKVREFTISYIEKAGGR